MPTGDMTERGPRFEVGVDVRYQSGRPDVLRRGDRTGIQRVQVIRHPEGVRAHGGGSQIGRVDGSRRRTADVDRQFGYPYAELLHSPTVHHPGSRSWMRKTLCGVP